MSSSNGTAPDTSNTTAPDATDAPVCGPGNNEVAFFGLRIASIFIIMIASMGGALFPVLSRRIKGFSVPRSLFDFAKYFGSGVIIATAFIHLLSPALDELGSPCLTGAWQNYPWALALCMFSVFSIFLVELFAFRWGSAKLAAIGISVGDSHGHAFAQASSETAQVSSEKADVEVGVYRPVLDNPVTQIIGIAILEFGIQLHSVLIGLTLAVDERFKVLFIVIVFHQTFEGLGLGSRLAYMDLPEKYNWVPLAGAVLYGFTTPIGIAAGLGVRSTYNPGSTTASIVSGVLDALSSGILLYTGLVELLAHEFLFNNEMSRASNGRLVYSVVCMLTGAGLMSLLGNWA